METEEADMENQAGTSSPSRVSKHQTQKPVTSDVIMRRGYM